jgi:hypothetical protein
VDTNHALSKHELTCWVTCLSVNEAGNCSPQIGQECSLAGGGDEFVPPFVSVLIWVVDGEVDVLGVLCGGVIVGAFVGLEVDGLEDVDLGVEVEGAREVGICEEEVEGVGGMDLEVEVEGVGEGGLGVELPRRRRAACAAAWAGVRPGAVGSGPSSPPRRYPTPPWSISSISSSSSDDDGPW